MSGAHCERCGRLMHAVQYRNRDGSISPVEWVHECTNPANGWIGLFEPRYDTITGERIK